MCSSHADILLSAEKKPVEYGNVKAQINTLQDVFQEINASLVPDSMQIKEVLKETCKRKFSPLEVTSRYESSHLVSLKVRLTLNLKLMLTVQRAVASEE